MKGLIIHSSLARQDPYLGISMAFSTRGQRGGGEARVCTDVVRLKSGRVSRALFPRPSSPSSTRHSRESRDNAFQAVHTRVAGGAVQSYLAVNSIGDTDARPSRPRFFNRSLDSISRRMVVGSSRRRGNRRSSQLSLLIGTT